MASGWFRCELVASPAVGEPALPAMPPAYAGMRRPTEGDDPMMRMLLPVGRSGWAIAAGYLGLLSFLGVFAPISLIVGFVALRDLKQHPEKHGLGRTWFGIIMGVLGTIVLLFAIAATMMPGMMPK